MFAEALQALAAFTEEATGMPARLGARQVIAAAEATGDGRAATAKKGGGAGGGAASADPDGDLIAPDGGPLAAAVAEDVVTLSLVSVHRTERFRNNDREVLAAGSGSVTVRQPPGWFDLTVVIEPGGDQITAAEATERLLAAVIRQGDISSRLEVGGDYPVYASIDTPTPDELQGWLLHGWTRGSGAAVRAVVTVAVQPHEADPVGIVRSRRIHTEHLRTHVRETIER